MTQDLTLLTYLTIGIAAFLASGLTLFTGFGLGTLLMPVFALFFPVDVSIALTAIVHLANNLFKLLLYGRYANGKTVLHFGFPALVTSFLGAKSLVWFSQMEPIFRYTCLGKELEILPINILMSLLMILFALFELFPKIQLGSFREKHLAIGGILSGFFGGLSGHQGAFRSAFLIKTEPSKESFIGTGVVIACLVDTIRIFVYGVHFKSAEASQNGTILIWAIVLAFLGIMLGSLWLKKVTIKLLQKSVAVLLAAIAITLGMGLLT
jgi:uncharacterized membrane protein YfcA